MAHDEFTTVVHHRNIKKRFVITNDSPYPIMTADEAFRLQKIHKIRKLQETLMSDESIRLQKEGWVFNSVLKEGAIPNFANPLTFITLLVPNEWNDKIFFIKVATNVVDSEDTKGDEDEEKPRGVATFNPYELLDTDA